MGRPNLDVPNIELLEIPFPDNIDEQNAIVQEIESRLSLCDKIEESITHSLWHAEALRQSIRKEAVEGKLVCQYPLSPTIQGLRFVGQSNWPERYRLFGFGNKGSVHVNQGRVFFALFGLGVGHIP